MIRPKAAFATIALAALLAGCGGDDDGGGEVPEGTAAFEDEDFPFTFAYPEDWMKTTDVSIATEAGNAADETIFVGPDEDNGIVLQRFTLQGDVTEDNLSEAKAEFDDLILQVDPEAPEASETELIGLPTLEYDEIQLATPEDGESRYNIFFDGDQEYLINCQSTPDSREEIDAACQEALDSLEER